MILYKRDEKATIQRGIVEYAIKNQIMYCKVNLESCWLQPYCR